MSSLFSILSLFTEDIKLAWTPPVQEEDEELEENNVVNLSRNPSDAGRAEAGSLRKKARADSDVSQMDNGTMGRRVASPDAILHAGPNLGRHRSLSADTSRSTLRQESRSSSATAEGEDISLSVSISEPPSPLVVPTTRPELRQVASIPRFRGRTPATARPLASPTRESPRKEKLKSPDTHDAGPAALQGTIARATVDTTLAVIPAKAFKTLTKKYPKASGTVVQVVLERFSRVTFMTGE